VLCPLLWVTLLGQGVGLGDPQRSLPTPPMLGFCDSVKATPVLASLSTSPPHRPLLPAGPHQRLLQRPRPRGPPVLPHRPLRRLPQPRPGALRHPPALAPLALQRLRSAQHLQPRPRVRLQRRGGAGTRTPTRHDGRRDGEPALLRELRGSRRLPGRRRLRHVSPGVRPAPQPGPGTLRRLRPHGQVRQCHPLLLHLPALGLRAALPAADADARLGRAGVGRQRRRRGARAAGVHRYLTTVP